MFSLATIPTLKQNPPSVALDVENKSIFPTMAMKLRSRVHKLISNKYFWAYIVTNIIVTVVYTKIVSSFASTISVVIGWAVINALIWWTWLGIGNGKRRK